MISQKDQKAKGVAGRCGCSYMRESEPTPWYMRSTELEVMHFDYYRRRETPESPSKLIKPVCFPPRSFFFSSIWHRILTQKWYPNDPTNRHYRGPCSMRHDSQYEEPSHITPSSAVPLRNRPINPAEWYMVISNYA